MASFSSSSLSPARRTSSPPHRSIMKRYLRECSQRGVLLSLILALCAYIATSEPTQGRKVNEIVAAAAASSSVKSKTLFRKRQTTTLRGGENSRTSEYSETSEEIVMCETFVECGSCVQQMKCGWLLDDADASSLHKGKCVAGKKEGPGDLEEKEANNFDFKRWDFDYCPAMRCRDYSDCTGCIADPFCGWCASSSKCVRGDARGPEASAENQEDGCPLEGFIHSPASRAVPHELHGEFAKVLGEGGGADMEREHVFSKETTQSSLEDLCASPDAKTRLDAEISVRPAPQILTDEVFRPNPDDHPVYRDMARKATELYDPPGRYRVITCAPCEGSFPHCICPSFDADMDGDLQDGPTGMNDDEDGYFALTGGTGMTGAGATGDFGLSESLDSIVAGA